MLGLDARRYGPDIAVRGPALSHIRVGVVEGLQRTGWLDLDVETRSARYVANR
jgi:hypothetical protein